jgi:hypothetical protein
MTALIILLILLALIVGGLGLLLKGLAWLLIIALVLLVASALIGFTRRRTA